MNELRNKGTNGVRSELTKGLCFSIVLRQREPYWSPTTIRGGQIPKPHPRQAGGRANRSSTSAIVTVQWLDNDFEVLWIDALQAEVAHVHPDALRSGDMTLDGADAPVQLYP